MLVELDEMKNYLLVDFDDDDLLLDGGLRETQAADYFSAL